MSWSNCQFTLHVKLLETGFQRGRTRHTAVSTQGPLKGDGVCDVATTNCSRAETRRATSGSYHFDMCVWRKVETVIHAQSQSPQSKSLGLEEMPDEVGILRRPTELMTSIRVALMGKRPSRPSPCPGPFSGQNFLNNGVKKDS